jgi:acetyltransferase-like isoleucine patch superfamily enzyme
MSRTLRLWMAVFVSTLPSNSLRCTIYRRLFGYKIVGTKVGLFTVIAVDEANLSNCTIGRFNKFVGPMRLQISDGAEIESHNVIECGEWAADASHHAQYAKTMQIGKNARITSYHFFDVAGCIVLGDGSWIAGRGSQFWTHGVGVVDRDIQIGKKSYVGSAVRFAPGSGVGDNVIVGLGSVVTKMILTSNALISGIPAMVVKEGRGWKPQ